MIPPLAFFFVFVQLLRLNQSIAQLRHVVNVEFVACDKSIGVAFEKQIGFFSALPLLCLAVAFVDLQGLHVLALCMVPNEVSMEASWVFWLRVTAAHRSFLDFVSVRTCSICGQIGQDIVLLLG